MCLLTYFPPNIQPDVQALRNGATTNDDGHGYAIICDGELIVGRSMSFEEVVAEFAALRAEFPEGPAMFHSRWGTCGAYGLENVHPFEVGKSGMTVVAHNGVLPFDAQPLKGDRRTDTRKFAQDIMPRSYGHLDSDRTRRRLEKWLGGGNKLVVLTVDPKYAASAYIFNEDAGIWTEEGIWYSNSGYLPSLYRYAGKGSARYYTEAEWYGFNDDGFGIDDRVWRKVKGAWRLLSRTDAARHDELIDSVLSESDDLDAIERDEYETWWRNQTARTDRAIGAVRRYPSEGYDSVTGTLFSDGVTMSLDSLGTVSAEATGAVERLAISAKPATQCATCDQLKVDVELRLCRACEYCVDCNTHITECLCYGDGLKVGEADTGWPTVIGPPSSGPDTTNANLCETVSCPGFQLASKCATCSGCDAVCFCD